MPPRSESVRSPRRRLFPRILWGTAVAVCLLVCVGFAWIWKKSDEGYLKRTWRSGLRTYQAAAWDGRVMLTIVGDWPDDRRAARGTEVLANRPGFAHHPGVDDMIRDMESTRDELQQSHGPSGTPPPTQNAMGAIPDRLVSLSMALASISNTLITEQSPRTRESVGVRVTRDACRVAMFDDAGRISFTPPVPAVIYSVPCWLAIAFFGVLPGIATARSLVHSSVQRHRLRHHLCPTCGYDTRASPGRCPECGAEPAPTPAARPAVTAAPPHAPTPS